MLVEINWACITSSSAGKESTCNAGDPSSIPGLGRCAEGIGYPLQSSWASLVAQLVKHPPAMQETWVWSLGWEDALKTGKTTHSRILAWRIPWTVKSMGSQRVGHDWGDLAAAAVGPPCGSSSKESACSAGDLGSIPTLGISADEGKGNPFQYSGLENSMDRIVYGVAKNPTQLSDFHFPSKDSHTITKYHK